MFSIVEFSKDNTVSYVPSTWLHGGKCYWPSGNDASKATLYRNENFSPKRDWKLHELKRVFCTAKNLNDAKKKEKRAQNQSNVDSDSEIETLSQKRIIKPNKKYSSESSNENEPIILKKKQRLKSVKFIEPELSISHSHSSNYADVDQAHSSCQGENLYNLLNSAEPKAINISKSNSIGAKCMSTYTQKNICKMSVPLKSTEKTNKTSSSTYMTQKSLPEISQTNCESCITTLEIVREIKTSIDKLTEANKKSFKKLLTELFALRALHTPRESKPEYIAEFPIKTVIEFEKLEQNLQNDEYRLNLNNRLESFLKNNNTYIKFYKILFETVFSIEFMSHCTWKKYKDNVSFSDSIFFATTIDVAKNIFSLDSVRNIDTIREIEKIFKKYKNKSRKRLGNQNKISLNADMSNVLNETDNINYASSSVSD